ncbi:MAG: hypothetical protein ACI3V0_04950 [Faecousia sp.]
MRRKMAWLLLLVFALSLTACGAAPAVTTVESTEVPTEAVTPALTEVEITMDNWQDYFELRESEQVQVNDRGAPVLREFGYGVFLKEEYKDRLPENGAAEVSFEMQVRSVRRQVYGDLVTDNFLIKDEVLNDEGDVVLTQFVEDWRSSGRMEPGSDFENAVAAFFTVNSEFAG